MNSQKMKRTGTSGKAVKDAGGRDMLRSQNRGEIMSKPVDLEKLIPDRYRCPACGEICVGLMNWAAHAAQAHSMSCIELEREYGPAETSYFTTKFNSFNPSKR